MLPTGARALAKNQSHSLKNSKETDTSLLSFVFPQPSGLLTALLGEPRVAEGHLPILSLWSTLGRLSVLPGHVCMPL